MTPERKAREVTAKFTTCMSALNKAKTDLAEVKESIKELERMLAKADERLIATKEEGKRERDALVKTALDGLSQLRGHLTVTLSALRPDPAGNYNSGEVDPPPKIKIADLIAPHVSAAAVFSPGGSGPAPVVKSWQRWKDQLQNKFENSTNEDYEYVVKGIDELVLTWIRYVPPRAGSYQKLPDWIQRKHCCVNIETKERQDCFRLSGGVRDPLLR